MPRNSERGGPQTRAKIAEIAAGLFAERGFDEVTVTQVAKAAGVSSVTVYNHFPRKEDLYLDRSDDAAVLLRASIRDREGGVDVLEGLRRTSLRLAEERHPLSGIDERSIPFFRTVAASTALRARAREIASELQQILVDELETDPDFHGDARLFAALFVGGYGSVLVETARRLIADEATTDETWAVVRRDHAARLDALFAALRGGILPA